MTANELQPNDDEKALIFTLGAMEALREQGVVIGSNWKLTPKGVALYDQLKASGYAVESEEQRDCLLYMLTMDAPDDDDDGEDDEEDDGDE